MPLTTEPQRPALPIVAPMAVVCAWCNQPEAPRGTIVSHGICPTCEALFFAPDLPLSSEFNAVQS